MFSISSTSKSKGCVSLPSEFALFSVKVKHLQEIVDSRVVLGGKHVSEDIHREQTGNVSGMQRVCGLQTRGGEEGVLGVLMRPIMGQLQLHKTTCIALGNLNRLLCLMSPSLSMFIIPVLTAFFSPLISYVVKN